MIQRLVVALLVVSALLGLILFSQFSSAPKHVSGFIEADEIRVGSRVGGRVLTVHVEQGQVVQQGQPMVDLEPYDLLQREQEAAKTLSALEADYQRLKSGFRAEEIAQAKARYEQFKAKYDLLVAGPREQEIDAAKGRLQVAESEQILAQQNYNRARGLNSEKAISQAEFTPSNVQTPEERSKQVFRIKVAVGVRIPPQYTDRMVRGEQVQVQVSIDGSDSQVATTAQSTAQLLGLNLSISIARAMGTRITERRRFKA